MHKSAGRPTKNDSTLNEYYIPKPPLVSSLLENKGICKLSASPGLWIIAHLYVRFDDVIALSCSVRIIASVHILLSNVKGRYGYDKINTFKIRVSYNVKAYHYNIQVTPCFVIYDYAWTIQHWKWDSTFIG